MAYATVQHSLLLNKLKLHRGLKQAPFQYMLKILFNSFKHLKKILIHKYWVYYFCSIAGIKWQGIIHDLSKFSWIEFSNGVKYYSDTESPIAICKKENGYSEAWQHHKGRNPHHHVYWCDNFDEGTTAIKMPMKYAIEMLCDFLGAGMAYNKCSVEELFDKEYDFWENRKKEIYLHPQTLDFINQMMHSLKMSNDKILTLKQAKITWKWLDELHNDIPANLNVRKYNVEKR